MSKTAQKVPKMTDKLKVGDKVVWCAPEKFGRGFGKVASYDPDHSHGQGFLIKWDGGAEISVTEYGTQNTNGMKWVRKLTPLEELL